MEDEEERRRRGEDKRRRGGEEEDRVKRTDSRLQNCRFATEMYR